MWRANQGNYLKKVPQSTTKHVNMALGENWDWYLLLYVIHVKNWDEIAGTTVVTVVNTMMNASKRTWRIWRQSRPSLGPGLKTAVSLMDMWTSENVEERMGR